MTKESGKKKDKQDQCAVNKKAYFNYELVEKIEAGVSLLGCEVKSLRTAQCDLEGSFARIDGSECWLIGCKIMQYAQFSGLTYDPLRKRKLLLRKEQIYKIAAKLDQRGFTLIPLRIYFNDRGFAKVELALAHGKRQYDKRAKIQQREQKKDIDRSMKKYRRG